MKDVIKYGLPWLIIFIIPAIISSYFDFKPGAIGVSILVFIAAGYYFNLDNPHRPFRIHIIIALLGWLITIPLSRELNAGNSLPHSWQLFFPVYIFSVSELEKINTG